MKLVIKTFLIVSIAILLASSAKAQDFVITAKGDSLPCNITTPFLGSPKYKVAGTNDAKKIRPDEIKEYYIARKNFWQRSVFKDSSTSPMFMTIVEKGKISLYEVIYTSYSNGVTNTTITWFVGKGSDYVSDLKTSALFSFKSKKKRKDIFADMLMDNKALYDKYKADDKFSFKQIRNLVHLYNTGQQAD